MQLQKKYFLRKKKLLGGKEKENMYPFSQQ